MSKTTISIIVIVIIVVVGGVIWYSIQGQNISSTQQMNQSMTELGSSTSQTSTSTNTVNASATTTIPSTSVPTSTKVPTQVSVSIKNFTFTPASLTVHKGTKVIWTNNDSVPHTVTGDNGGPASQTINPGQSYNYTFTTVGTFPYHCSIHPHMMATIEVIN